ncbi:Uncharacterised protein g6887 [Pycnogonum litorale]
MISDQRLKQRGTVQDACRLFMKDEIEINAAPCDFILGTCIISCVIVVGITVSYDIFKLMTGVGDDQSTSTAASRFSPQTFRLISFAMLGMHAVMTFLHLIIGIVAVVGFRNYCKVFGSIARMHRSIEIFHAVSQQITHLLCKQLSERG